MQTTQRSKIQTLIAFFFMGLNFLLRIIIKVSPPIYQAVRSMLRFLVWLIFAIYREAITLLRSKGPTLIAFFFMGLNCLLRIIIAVSPPIYLAARSMLSFLVWVIFVICTEAITLLGFLVWVIFVICTEAITLLGFIVDRIKEVCGTTRASPRNKSMYSSALLEEAFKEVMETYKEELMKEVSAFTLKNMEAYTEHLTEKTASLVLLRMEEYTETLTAKTAALVSKNMECYTANLTEKTTASVLNKMEGLTEKAAEKAVALFLEKIDFNNQPLAAPPRAPVHDMKQVQEPEIKLESEIPINVLEPSKHSIFQNASNNICNFNFIEFHGIGNFGQEPEIKMKPEIADNVLEPKKYSIFQNASINIHEFNFSEFLQKRHFGQEPKIKFEPDISVDLSESSNNSSFQNASVNIHDFNFIKFLGKGSFGQVYLAEQKDTHEKFAIKKSKDLLWTDYRTQCFYMSEKRILETLTRMRHPFVIHLFASVRTENNIFLILEYASGGNLFSYVEYDCIPEHWAQFYAACLILGLQFIHEQNIVHRDIKLENILLDNNGFVRIADFGLAKAGMSIGDTTKTQCGTPNYFAPELIEDKPYTTAVDWWALGIVIYRMLVGSLPFTGNEDELFYSIVHHSEEYPSLLSFDAVSVMMGLLSKNPKRRFGAEDLKKHEFFKDIDWEALLAKKVKPPFVPLVKA